MLLRIKNWSAFQHYKNRRPPWIKLHRTTLDDARFHRLPVASRALAPMLWLLASEFDNGVIDAPAEDIAWRLRMSEVEFHDALKPLIDSGFIVQEDNASKMIAIPKRTAIPEKETEREEEREESAHSPVFEIAKEHPKLSHLNDDTEIPYGVVGKILEAIDKDGFDKVLTGTRGYAESLDDPKFALDPYKFFSQFKYRPEAWRRGDTKPSRTESLLRSVSEISS